EAMNKDLVVGLGSRSSVTYLGEHTEEDYTVTLADTGAMSLIGARVKRVARHLDGRFMVTYGDGLANIDLRALIAFHEAHGRLVPVTTVRMPGRFGVIDPADDGRVQRFREKPTHEAWVSAGFFVFEPRVLDYLSDHESCTLEREPLERLVGDGELVA